MTTPRAARRWLTALLGVALLSTAVVALPGPAYAADLANFDPGFIISDAVFYDTTTMNADRVQSFLASAGGACSVGTDSSPCLKDYRETTLTRSATTRCATYQGAAGETAATIIAKVAQACGINPQVIIATLQKEQGLVTTTDPSASRYRSAMGYGCPDSSACNSLYYGFFNQVYSAASQFRNYALNPTSYAHRAGVVNDILFNPNTTLCGSSKVYIQNQATASLYNYTPYQPNAAALAAGYGAATGAGASCAAYGNRNFWNYFTDWFGPTTQRLSIGSIDNVATTWNSVSMAGWALDPDTTAPIQVHIYLDGHDVLASTADLARPDVGAAFGKGNNHGFNLTVPARAGDHSVCVYAIDSVPAGPNPQLGCRAVTVPSALAIGSIDGLVGGIRTISAVGWALDPDTTAAIQVHMYVDGVAVLGMVADSTRTDVGAVYGKGDQHGYAGLATAAPGQHTVCLYAIDANGGANPQIGCRVVVVAAAAVNHAPIGTLDSLTTAPGSIFIAGWALDPDTTAPIQVHIYVDGAPVLGRVADDLRTDVGSAYGDGDNHGFNWTVSVPTGTHTVCAYGIDSTLTGPNPAIGCRAVTVPAPPANLAPVGNVDLVTPGAASVNLAGWALDPDTTNPITVHVYLDGADVQTVMADSVRTDVGAAFGKGDNHGFSTSVSAASGPHSVCVWAIDSSLTGPNPRIGCSTVTVP